MFPLTETKRTRLLSQFNTVREDEQHMKENYKHVVFFLFFFNCLPGKVCVSVLFIDLGDLVFYFLSLMTRSMCDLWPPGPSPFGNHKSHTNTHIGRFVQTSHPKLSPTSVLAGEVTLIRPNCTKLVQLQRDTCVSYGYTCLQERI